GNSALGASSHLPRPTEEAFGGHRCRECRRHLRLGAAASGAEARRIPHVSRSFSPGTVGQVRFGPVSGVSSGFPPRQLFSFLLLSTRPSPFRFNGSQVRVLPRELPNSPRWPGPRARGITSTRSRHATATGARAPARADTPG